MEDDGIWILQMADLPNMLLNNMFDNICHEHLTYFTMYQLNIMLHKNCLKIFDIKLKPIKK